MCFITELQNQIRSRAVCPMASGTVFPINSAAGAVFGSLPSAHKKICNHAPTGVAEITVPTRFLATSNHSVRVGAFPALILASTTLRASTVPIAESLNHFKNHAMDCSVAIAACFFIFWRTCIVHFTHHPAVRSFVISSVVCGSSFALPGTHLVIHGYCVSILSCTSVLYWFLISSGSVLYWPISLGERFCMTKESNACPVSPCSA